MAFHSLDSHNGPPTSGEFRGHGRSPDLGIKGIVKKVDKGKQDIVKIIQNYIYYPSNVVASLFAVSYVLGMAGEGKQTPVNKASFLIWLGTIVAFLMILIFWSLPAMLTAVDIALGPAGALGTPTAPSENFTVTCPF